MIIVVVFLLLFQQYTYSYTAIDGVHPVQTPVLANQHPISAVRIDKRGNISEAEVLKQDLAHDLHLPIRDFRVVDPSLPNKIKCTFTARPNAILFCIERIKVIVRQDEALIFSEEVRDFIPALRQQITLAGSELATVNSARFEHIVIEAALNVVCNSLFDRVRALSPRISSALGALTAESRGLDVVQTQIDELLPLKNEIDELGKRVKEIRRAITEILNNDEDMGMMYLGEHRMKDGAEVDTTNLEMLFETYFNEVEWIFAEVEELTDEITNTEENVMLQIDLVRNRILKFELTLSIASFVAGVGAMIGGIFGMNLLSYMELHKYMFYVITSCTMSLCGGIYLYLTRYCKREKLF
jgi:magnesium transporter